jgi:hypothetical protein
MVGSRVKSMRVWWQVIVFMIALALASLARSEGARFPVEEPRDEKIPAKVWEPYAQYMKERCTYYENLAAREKDGTRSAEEERNALGCRLWSRIWEKVKDKKVLSKQEDFLLRVFKAYQRPDF